MTSPDLLPDPDLLHPVREPVKTDQPEAFRQWLDQQWPDTVRAAS